MTVDGRRSRPPERITDGGRGRSPTEPPGRSPAGDLPPKVERVTDVPKKALGRRNRRKSRKKPPRGILVLPREETGPIFYYEAGLEEEIPESSEPITTAAGLLVAIPALIFYLYFVGRVDGLIMEIDHYGQEIVNLISFEALEDRKLSRASIPRRKAA